jgi:hypothetical protein
MSRNWDGVAVTMHGSILRSGMSAIVHMNSVLDLEHFMSIGITTIRRPQSHRTIICSMFIIAGGPDIASIGLPMDENPSFGPMAAVIGRR